jgi:mono/diheme cytochrome c family protein
MSQSRGARRRITRIVAIAAAAAIVATSCGGDSRTDSEIPVQNADLVASGDVLYQASCAECHGSDLRGTDKGPSHLSVVYVPGHHGDEAFLVAIRAGTREHHWNFGNMESVDGLSDNDITAIIAFVRENQRIEGFEPYPP